MSITVKDLLELNSFKSFRLIAGSSGLNKSIEATGIVDWEFVQGIASETIRFDKNSLVISSLLFAKEDESLLYNAVKSLIHSGVGAMAYKDIFIKELPEEVIKLANNERFPIFAFDTVYFEDILTDIHDAILTADQLSVKSETLKLLLNSDLTVNEVLKSAKKMIPHIMKNVFAAYVFSKERFYDGEIIRMLQNSSHYKNDDYEITICGYNGGVMMIVSANHHNQKKYAEIINDLLSATILYKSETTLGMSGVYPYEKLDRSVKEALYACTSARLEQKKSLYYKDIGIYQFLIPGRDFEPLLTFMYGYLEPILDQNNSQCKELLETAIAFVRGNGNFKTVSEELHIHENTLRYRLNKLHKLLDPNSTEFSFYQNLTIAIQSYLIQQL